MEMTKNQVARIAKNMLKVIEDNKLNGLKAITEAVGRQINPKVDDKYSGDEIVRPSVQPSNQGSVCIALSYFRRNGQVPLEIKINPKLGYAVIMVTCTEKLPGFEVFDESSGFGKLQDKKVMRPSLDFVKLELKALSKLK